MVVVVKINNIVAAAPAGTKRCCFNAAVFSCYAQGGFDEKIIIFWDENCKQNVPGVG